MCIYICMKMCIYNIHYYYYFFCCYYWNHYLPLQRSESVQNRNIYCSCLFNSWENSQFLLTNIQIFYQFDPLSDACWNLLLLYKSLSILEVSTARLWLCCFNLLSPRSSHETALRISLPNFKFLVISPRSYCQIIFFFFVFCGASAKWQ